MKIKVDYRIQVLAYIYLILSTAFVAFTLEYLTKSDAKIVGISIIDFLCVLISSFSAGCLVHHFARQDRKKNVVLFSLLVLSIDVVSDLLFKDNIHLQKVLNMTEEVLGKNPEWTSLLFLILTLVLINLGGLVDSLFFRRD